MLGRLWWMPSVNLRTWILTSSWRNPSHRRQCSGFTVAHSRCVRSWRGSNPTMRCVAALGERDGVGGGAGGPGPPPGARCAGGGGGCGEGRWLLARRVVFEGLDVFLCVERAVATTRGRPRRCAHRTRSHPRWASRDDFGATPPPPPPPPP